MRKKVGDALLRLGITPDLKGFNYIIDMVEMIDKEGDIKIIAGYEIVGKKHKSDGSKVERAIRHAIERLNPTSEKYMELIGADISSQTSYRITNSAFLYTLHYRLKEG